METPLTRKTWTITTAGVALPRTPAGSTRLCRDIIAAEAPTQ